MTYITVPGKDGFFMAIERGIFAAEQATLCRPEVQTGKEIQRDQIRLLIIDVDDSYLEVEDPNGPFYRSFQPASVRAASIHYDIPETVADVLVAASLHLWRRPEAALYNGDLLAQYFPMLEKKLAGKPPGYAAMHDEMNKLDPRGAYRSHAVRNARLQRLREESNIKVVAFTNAPDVLNQNCFWAADIDPQASFDSRITMQREFGPPKVVLGAEAYDRIMVHHKASPQEVMLVGNNHTTDILPGEKLGAGSCLIGDPPPGYTGLAVPTFDGFLDRMGV